jgi:hypothetical protein
MTIYSDIIRSSLDCKICSRLCSSSTQLATKRDLGASADNCHSCSVLSQALSYFDDALSDDAEITLYANSRFNPWALEVVLRLSALPEPHSYETFELFTVAGAL